MRNSYQSSSFMGEGGQLYNPNRSMSGGKKPNGLGNMNVNMFDQVS
jgi:hypothetical protein